MDGVEEVEEAMWQAFGDFLVTYQVPLRILLIVTLAVLLNWMLRRVLMRTVTRIVTGVKRAQNVDTTSEMQAAPYVNARAVQRTRTLGTVGRAAITWLVVVVALILVLAELDVNVGALVASAGIVGAGLAFGAQNIVKDILNGIFMVFEDQLGVGDWITVGEISGTVEDVGIRVTQVRGIDGTLWFVRNGEVLTLGNASQGWGRALIDITVEADADLDEVERVTLDSAKELLQTPETARKITGAPEVWGVESAFGDRATLRLAIRTRPEAQWAVQRAMRPVLVRRFAEAGIQLATELPQFPGGKK
ncbi:mechanosensitive ion channel family protein [Leucobacter triazinivorans]|nr:mechanosensitive ion channel family protein [Leucobacter triazinivorans]